MESISGDKLRGHLELLILATLERGEAQAWKYSVVWKPAAAVFSP
jgi:hypothetical protein